MKKIYIIIFSFCFVCNYSNAQVPIGDAVLLSKLHVLFPNCWNANGDLDTTCTDITTIRHLDLIGPGLNGMTGKIMSMNGLQYFDSLRYLNIQGNSISDLRLPPMLDTLVCDDQTNTTLGSWTSLEVNGSSLPAGLRYLSCNSNRGIGGTLPPGLTWLSCVNMYMHFLTYGITEPVMQSLPALPSTLRYLNCSYNILTSLPPLPDSLKYLNCSYNKYDDDWLGINYHYPGIAVLPPLPAGLIDLSASGNGFTEVPLLPVSLAYLDVSVNSVNCLPLLPVSMAGVSPYHSASSANLLTGYTGINCTLNDVPGIRESPVLPVCTVTNDTHGCAHFPHISAGPGITGLTTFVGTASAAGSYILSAQNLNPASGNIVLTASANLEISLDNVNFSSSPVSVPYSGGGLTNATVFVRIGSSAVFGTFSGTVINSGGGAADVVVSVSGTVMMSTPYFVTGPDISGLGAFPGTPGTAGTYTLTGFNLVPGTITLTASSSLEISFDNINFSNPVSFYNNLGALPARTVYVRISASAPPGPVSGTVTNSGGGAPDVTVNVSGAMGRQYYNTKANLGLLDPASWSTTIDGSGPSPVSINAAGQVFNIINPDNVNYNGVWNLPATSSKIIVGDGIHPITFTILPGADYVSATTKIDVLNNGTLKMLNTQLPTLNLIADGSTIDFAQAGTTEADRITIPSHIYYNLKLTNGVKYVDLINTPNLTATGAIKNNFIADATSLEIGSVYNNLVNCFGDVYFINGTTFDGAVNGSNGHMALLMNGAGPVQHIITDPSVTIKLRTLERDSASAVNIIMSPGAKMEVDEVMKLKPANCTLSTSGGEIRFIRNVIFSYTYAGKINSSGTSFDFAMTGAGFQAPVPFTDGSVVKNFKANFNTANNANWDHIKLDQNIIITDTLTLTSGRVFINPGYVLSLASTAVVVGGDSTSFIEGPVKRTGNSNLLFPVGNGYKTYRPVKIGFLPANIGGTYTVQYTKTGLGNYLIDPATVSLYPNYYVSNYEYWNITPGAPGIADSISFFYTDASSHIAIPAGLRMAHFDGADWNDIAGMPNALNTTTNGSVTVLGVSQFSPFTFASADNTVVPVKLTGFTATKQSKLVKLNWTTEQEINSKLFVIERSFDQNKWNAIISVHAAGNSSQKINYNTTDLYPAKGINYYRLKSMDVDGRCTYSEIRPVYFGDDMNIVLAPNPAKDKVFIYLPSHNTIVTVKLFNSKGQLVKQSSSAEAYIQLNVADLPKGMYTIKLNDENMNAVKQLVIQ